MHAIRQKSITKAQKIKKRQRKKKYKDLARSSRIWYVRPLKRFHHLSWFPALALIAAPAMRPRRCGPGDAAPAMRLGRCGPGDAARAMGGGSTPPSLPLRPPPSPRISLPLRYCYCCCCCCTVVGGVGCLFCSRFSGDRGNEHFQRSLSNQHDTIKDNWLQSDDIIDRIQNLIHPPPSQTKLIKTYYLKLIDFLWFLWKSAVAARIDSSDTQIKWATSIGRPWWRHHSFPDDFKAAAADAIVSFPFCSINANLTSHLRVLIHHRHYHHHHYYHLMNHSLDSTRNRAGSRTSYLQNISLEILAGQKRPETRDNSINRHIIRQRRK